MGLVSLGGAKRPACIARGLQAAQSQMDELVASCGRQGGDCMVRHAFPCSVRCAVLSRPSQQQMARTSALAYCFRLSREMPMSSQASSCRRGTT